MNTIGVIFLVAFLIICVLLVSIVLVQNDAGGGMGGLFGNAGSAAFGSRSGSVLVKTTYGLVALFFVTSFVLAFLNRVPTTKVLDPSLLQVTTAESSGGPSWLEAEDDAAAPATLEAAPPADAN
jgi:preprotein translocase subunit SecG